MFGMEMMEEAYVLDDYIHKMEKKIHRQKELKKTYSWERAKARAQRELEDDTQVLTWLMELNDVKRKEQKTEKKKKKFFNVIQKSLVPALCMALMAVSALVILKTVPMVTIEEEDTVLSATIYEPVELTIGDTMRGYQVINMINALSEYEGDRDNYIVVNNGKSMVSYRDRADLKEATSKDKPITYIESGSVYEVMDYIETETGKMIALKIKKAESRADS